MIDGSKRQSRKEVQLSTEKSFRFTKGQKAYKIQCDAKNESSLVAEKKSAVSELRNPSFRFVQKNSVQNTVRCENESKKGAKKEAQQRMTRGYEEKYEQQQKIAWNM